MQVKEKSDYRKISSLDTYEQVRKIGKNGGQKVGGASGTGISVNSLSNKVGRMVYKHSYMSPLIDYAEQVSSPNVAQYKSVMLCGRTITQSDNRYLKQDFYCGSRLCPICSRVRSEKIADVVLCMIDEGKDWVSLTLTNSNKDLDFNIDNLEERLRIESDFFNRSRDKYRKRKKEFSAIISLEIIPPGYKTKNKDGSGGLYYADYHPHYHILCLREFAEFLVAEWLKEFKSASPINQKIISVRQRAIDKDKSITIALRDVIKEVVKYSLKVCLPKIKSSGYSCFNVEGVDRIVTMLKGKKRLKKWGCFVVKDNEINKIESASISELDNHKQEYIDLPVKDKGDMIKSKSWNGRDMSDVPEFVKDVTYEFDYKRQNYFYVDNDTGIEYALTDYRKRPVRIMVCKGKDIVKYIKNE